MATTISRVVLNVFSCVMGEGIFLVVILVLSISNITSENAGINLNDKANAQTSDTETCLPSESDRNKSNSSLKGTVTQIGKALINDRLGVSKVS